MSRWPDVDRRVRNPTAAAEPVNGQPPRGCHPSEHHQPPSGTRADDSEAGIGLPRQPARPRPSSNAERCEQAPTKDHGCLSHARRLQWVTR